MPSIDSNYLKLLHLSLYVINKQSEIETNPQSESQAFDCTVNQIVNIDIIHRKS